MLEKLTDKATQVDKIQMVQAVTNDTLTKIKTLANHNKVVKQ